QSASTRSQSASTRSQSASTRSQSASTRSQSASTSKKASPAKPQTRRPKKTSSSTDYFAKPASVLRGIGPKKAEALDDRGLGTVGALLSFLPRTYQDRSKAQKLAELVPGSQSVAAGTISISAQVGHGSRARWEILLEDASGSLRLVFFRYRAQDMRSRYDIGSRLTVLGEVSRRQGGMQMVHPRMNPRAKEASAGVHPVYPEIRGLNAQEIGRAVQAAAEPLRNSPVVDLLPLEVRDAAKVMELNDALLLLHAPPANLSPADVDKLQARTSKAHLRLAFEELFVLQLALCLRQKNAQTSPAPSLATLPTSLSADKSPTSLAGENLVKAAPSSSPDEVISAMSEQLLPFTLTGAQHRATKEVFADLAREAPMGRLLQGDVGAGKTAVAALACLKCVQQKYQVAIMAPTEILAEQHAATLRKWFSPLGFRVELLTGSIRSKARRLLLAELQNREIDILVGTHALVQDDVLFRRLGLCIVDEQHRFGVEQRAKLKAKGPLLSEISSKVSSAVSSEARSKEGREISEENRRGKAATEFTLELTERPKESRRKRVSAAYDDDKAGSLNDDDVGNDDVGNDDVGNDDVGNDDVGNDAPARLVPHLLVMTATPIPRSLALTVYGELAVSILDELPPGRTPIETKVLSSNDEELAYVAIAEAMQKDERAYVVYPLIEESETLDLEDATRGYQDLCERFGEEKVDLLHGRMKGAEKDAIMQRFAAGEISVLVSTTVIEVGVDVPEATVMTVVNSERFGLSQLHQLRGRVGRSHRVSRCFLLLGQSGGGRDAIRRLRIMEETCDGFRIAEEDLLIRGPGDFLGTRQSGLPTLQFASLAEHQSLVEKARQQALLFVEDDPELSRPEHASLRQLVMVRYQERLALAGSG
ncbi:MAG: ATP-dependent DNA helicase RecG, partial [Deltaproteobacteria bacterium]|nr:ATP-dependent DNA helicase RecG [Deltaproteobacteria bacterium]